MSEVLTLTAPQTILTYSILSIRFHWDQQFISVEVQDNTGKVIVCNYSGIVALSLMIALNKANLSTTSLQKRILNQLVTDNKIPSGTVTGTPD